VITGPPPDDARRKRRQQRTAAVAFLLSAAGTILFCVAYFVVGRQRLGLTQNELLGSGFGVAMGGLSIGLVLLGKAAMPEGHGEQEREPHHSPPKEERQTAQLIVEGTEQLGLRNQPFLRRSLLVALGILPVPFVIGLRDVGPRPRARMRMNSWKAGDLLIDESTKRPLRVGDLEIGSMTSVMPEGATDPSLPVAAESAVVVIRLPPGVNKPLPGREDWAVDDLVAYSKICTHAGCPASLYNVDTHQLICPCHQSTFDVLLDCKPVFGPASRSLPQLPIAVNGDGYVVAQAPYDQAVGPGFWNRG
jgi:ubiquinol-cytochrome c reductase iron-sulfur subunit